MDKQYLNDEFNRFFDFPTEDKSQVSSVSCKLFAEHIAYPMERELENMKRIERVCKAKLNGDFGAAAPQQDRDAPVVAWHHEVEGLSYENHYVGNIPLIVKPGEEK